MGDRKISVGLCGFGIVGQGVYDHLTRKRKLLAEQLGADISVARVAVRDKSKKRDVEIDPSLITEDSLSVATDPEIDVVCELMGGTGLALEIVTRALVAGKIVVTANKALLCDHGKELLAAAHEHGGHLLFEGYRLLRQ